MTEMLGESFPFGTPIKPVVQMDRRRKPVFVLGVYASAVHARWIGNDGRTRIAALAVASEPEIFWRGEGADAIIDGISLPKGAGRLVAAHEKLNGPSGRALDNDFLVPLGLDRSACWLCDLLPVSRRNPNQTEALARSYNGLEEEMGLPSYHWPEVPTELASEVRRIAIEQEVSEASPEIFITLGDQPLRWFTRYYKSRPKLAAYGKSEESYGRLHDLEIAGRRIKLLPLVHPRQSAKLGNHSSGWAELHKYWTENVAPKLLDHSTL